jgi:hypothetical protein
MKTLFVAVLFCWMAAGSSRAQIPAPLEKNDSTNGLSVWLYLRWDTNSAVFHAPATIDILAYVRLQPSPRAGDVVHVEFFADAKRLGSGNAVWHDEIGPQRGKWHGLGPPPAEPMVIIAAQFRPAEWVWKNVPAGTYVLTAKAAWTDGVATVSAPVKVTVLP